MSNIVFGRKLTVVFFLILFIWKCEWGVDKGMNRTTYFTALYDVKHWVGNLMYINQCNNRTKIKEFDKVEKQDWTWYDKTRKMKRLLYDDPSVIA